MNPYKILVLIDLQNDFIDGSLGTNQAQAIIPQICEKIRNFNGDMIFATLDTHDKNYLSTDEGKHLPVEHCIKGTDGWYIQDDVMSELDNKKDHVFFIKKNAFASVKGMYGDRSLISAIDNISSITHRPIEIEVCGLVSDICVVANVLMLKAYFHDIAEISVDSTCCAGTTEEKHNAAMSIMESNQITVKR